MTGQSAPTNRPVSGETAIALLGALRVVGAGGWIAPNVAARMLAPAGPAIFPGRSRRWWRCPRREGWRSG